MTNALIDNSTVTAVERVLGRIPIERDYDLSGDLSAFESYLSALLFYDNPSTIGDYKPEYAASRSKFFSELGTVVFRENSYAQLLDESRRLTQDALLKIHGGNLQDNVLTDMLKNLELFVCPAWHMQSSDFFFRIRLLSGNENAVGKYTPLMSAIFQQLSETKSLGVKPDWRKELVSSSGEPITDSAKDGNRQYSVGGDVKAFAAGLNWLSLRSTFYALCSEHLGATAFVHPIRSDFLGQFYVRRITADKVDTRAAVLKYFKANTSSMLTSASEVLGDQGFKIQTPLISAWAVAVAGGPLKARDLILDKRDSKEGLALRDRMRAIEELHHEVSLDKARRAAAALFRDYQSSVLSFFRKYGKATDDPYGVSANVLSMSGTFKVLPLLDRVKSLLPANRRSISLLRNITLDLMQSPTLGKISDLLQSDVKFESDPYQTAYSPKVESPRFRYVRSHWKEPM